MSFFSVMLVAYKNGQKIGNFPQPLKFDLAIPSNDTPALTLTYSRQSPGFDLMAEHPIIAMEVYNPRTDTWFEPPASRFIPVSYKTDRLDELEVVEFTCPGLLYVYKKLLVYPLKKGTITAEVEGANVVEREYYSRLKKAEGALMSPALSEMSRRKLPTDRVEVLYDVSAPPGAFRRIWVSTTGTATAHIWTGSEWFGLTSAANQALAKNAWTAKQDHSQSQTNLQHANDRTKELKRVWNNTSPGKIIAELWEEAKARPGRLANLTKSFTQSADSAGQAWPASPFTTEIPVGENLLDLMESFSNQEQMDFRTNKMDLELYKPYTALARDFTDTIALHYGAHIVEAPDDVTYDANASEVLVLGDDGLNFTLDNPEAANPWGVWETSISQAGIDDETTGRLLGKGVLDSATGVRIQRTREVRFDQNEVLPFVDYMSGDYILAPGADGTMEKQRVYQITISMDINRQEFYGNILLNDRFEERDIRNAKKTSAILGGTTPAGTGGTRDPEKFIDWRIPQEARHVNAEATTQIIKTGGYQSFVNVSWTWSGRATDGTVMPDSIDHWRVRYRLYAQSPRDEWGNVQHWREVRAGGEDRLADFGPVPTYQPNSINPAVYEVQVRGVARNAKQSDWSDTFFVEMPEDDVPPVTPSAPIAEANGSIIYIEWDGLNEVGGQPPLDFHRLYVEEAVVPPEVAVTPIPTAGADPLTIQDQMGTLDDPAVQAGLTWTMLDEALGMPGRFPIAGREYNTRYIYRFIAEDQTGNRSAPSVISDVVIPKPLVDVDAIKFELAAANKAREDADIAINETLTTLDGELDTANQTLGTHSTALGTLEQNLANAKKAIEDEQYRAENAEKDIISMIGDSQQITNSINDPVTAGTIGTTVGDIWWQRNATGTIIGQWEWMGGETVEGWEKRTVGDEMIANLDAGKLTAGTVDTARLDAETVTAVVVESMNANHHNLIVTGNAILNQATVIGGIAADEVAASKIGTDQLVANDAVMDTAVINKLFTDIFAAKKITATELNIGAINTTGGIADAAVDSVQIKDGAVNALKVQTDAILARHIKALEIDTGHLAANAVTADKADIGSLTAAIVTSDLFVGKTFQGGVFEGGVFRSGKSNFEGVVVFGAGIRVHNDQGVRMVDINSTNGHMYAGRIKSGTEKGPGIVVSNAGASWNGNDQGIWFTRDGGVYGWGNQEGYAPVAGMFTTADIDSMAQDHPLHIRGFGMGGVKLWETVHLESKVDNRTAIQTSQGLSIRTTGGLDFGINSNTNLVLTTGNAPTYGLYMRSKDMTAYDVRGTSGGTLKVSGTNGKIVADYSSRRWKTDIRPAERDERVFDIEPSWFKSTDAIEQAEHLDALPKPMTEEQALNEIALADELRDHFGAIAEQVEDTGLTELVNHDAEGLPASLKMELLGLKLLPFVKELWDDYKTRNGLV